MSSFKLRNVTKNYIKSKTVVDQVDLANITTMRWQK
ncbi:hypothetical protein J2S10_003498 [Neobacillus ginsengisoli]|uniref:ABC transporter ATP-binding protein n=1 Tax=Neobacillus ginsengisoli TaxID=904295 RepID=A0ABT9XXL6_9BACI|nr:hypothetical protein [Neobacillus ginsengisoli]